MGTVNGLTGNGIDPQHAKRIFEPFFTTKSHGMGMGLSICRSIIEHHGGQLSVAPGRKHGSIFRVALPTAPPVATPAIAPAPTAPPTIGAKQMPSTVPPAVQAAVRKAPWATDDLVLAPLILPSLSCGKSFCLAVVEISADSG